MTLIEQVRGEMMTALKERNSEKKEALSGLLSALKAKAIDKRSDLTLEEEQAVVSREVKQLKETIETAPQGYDEIVDKSKRCIEYFFVYLPAQMSTDDIKAAIEKVIKDLAIAEPAAKDKGIIMKNLMPLTKGKADGALVNEILATYFN